jgi:SWIM zinc finger
MRHIPSLTEHKIRSFVGKQNFSKGLRSVHNGAIVNPVQQDMTLKAYCYGSLPEPYRVQITFDGIRITTAFCSCSEDTSRDEKHGCEHAAALLLTWHMQPEVEWQLTMPPLPGHKRVPDEEDMEQALQLLEAAKPHGPEGCQWKYDSSRTPQGALKAAQHAEESYPGASIDLYQQHVERLITGRGRGNYQIACHYLVKIRSLYEKLDETEQWTSYITRLRKRHIRQHMGSILSTGATRIGKSLLLAIGIQFVQVNSHIDQMHAKGCHLSSGFLQHLVPLLPARLKIRGILCCGQEPGILLW